MFGGSQNEQQVGFVKKCVKFKHRHKHLAANHYFKTIARYGCTHQVKKRTGNP